MVLDRGADLRAMNSSAEAPEDRAIRNRKEPIVAMLPSEAMRMAEREAFCMGPWCQGYYLAHKKTPTPPGPP